MWNIEVNVKRELSKLVLLFLFIVCLNVVAIIAYDTRWSELWTEMPFVGMLTLFLFAVQFLMMILMKLIKRKK